MIKIQVFSRAFPGDNSTGAKVYFLNFLKYLKEKDFKIELVILDHSPGGRSSIFLIRSDILKYSSLYIRDHIRIKQLLFRYKSLTDWIVAPLGILYYLLPTSKRKKIVRRLSSKFLKILNFIDFNAVSDKSQKRDKPLTYDNVAIIRSRIEEFNPDVVIVNYVWLSIIFDLPDIKNDFLKVILTHEVVHQRVESGIKYGIKWNYDHLDRNKESEYLRKAHVILAIQNEDKKTFQKMAKECDVISMPMPASIHSPSAKQIHGRCLFVGSGGESTNIYGLNWFLKKSWPLILKSLPFCTLHICGSVCDEIEGNYKNVFLRGIVDNLEREYSASEVCIAPLLFGSGLKIKIVEALSYSRVCVTTRIGAQGLTDIIDKAIIVSKDSEDFAEAVELLIRNKNKRLQMEKFAEKYIMQNLSSEIVYQPFIDRIQRYVKEKA